MADTETHVYEVSEVGTINKFFGSQRSENLRCFLDRLKGFEPSISGTLQPKHNDIIHQSAQWLSGIAAGAWFELHTTSEIEIYRFRRISPYGNIDVDAFYKPTRKNQEEQK